MDILVIKRELEQWKRRNLSPIGKICIVKSLILSKLVHIFIALPNPSVQCIKNLERMLFYFIWGHKNDKIKRTKLVQPYSEGGLKMVHVDSFINSMKLTWLRRINAASSDWVTLSMQTLPECELLLTYGSMKLNKLREKTTNRFYKDMLDSLVRFDKAHEPCDEDIVSEKIWFSNWSKYETSVIKKWDDKGLRFIGDLYNPDRGVIYTRRELEVVYGIKMTFLCYASLIRSLPQNIREKINAVWIKRPNIPYKINLVLNHNKFSRYAYNTFVTKVAENNVQSNQRLETKWITDIGKYVEGTSTTVASATSSTFLIYFHFKIVNRIYATNKYLFNINVSQSSACSFCDDNVETIFHLFWVCPKTQIFIKEILSHLKEEFNVNIRVNASKWFLLTEMSSIEVLIVTLIKASIHKSRMSKSQLSLEKMLQSLKLEASKEYRIARSKEKTCVFEQKWGNLKKLAA